MSVVWYY